jgi:sugar phosphate isomerase/epimerase
VKLAISNIAWRPEEKGAAYQLLQDLGVRGLEIAPGLLFAREHDPFQPSEKAVALALEETRRAALELVSMQSLLFGVDDALLFGSDSQCERFVSGLVRAVDLAARLGIRNLVVGSPANRVVPPNMDRLDALSLAADIFRKLGEYAMNCGCQLALEPNPVAYGTNFLTNIAEAHALVRMVNHPAVTINLDIGALHVNGEFTRLNSLFSEIEPHVSHIHVSEAHLAPVPADPLALVRSFAALKAGGWRGWVSIEMRAGPGDRLKRVRHAVESCLAAMGAKG